MGSLTTSGWNEEDCKNELGEILSFFNCPKSLLNKMLISYFGFYNELQNTDYSFPDDQTYFAALHTVKETYLDFGLNEETQQAAFFVAEILEYLKSKNDASFLNVIRDSIDTIIDHDNSDELRPSAIAIFEYCIKLMQIHGFRNIQTFQTFSSKRDSQFEFTKLNVICSDNSVALRKLILINKIVKDPEYYINNVLNGTENGFYSYFDYLDGLANIDLDLGIKDLIDNGDLSVSFIK